MSHVPNILYLIECGGWLHRWVCNMYAPPFDIWCCSPNAQIKTYKWCARYVTKCRSSSMLKFKKCKKGDLRLSVGRKRKCTPFLHIGFQLNYRNYSDELHFIKRSGELSYHIFFEFLLNSTSGFLNCVQFFFFMHMELLYSVLVCGMFEGNTKKWRSFFSNLMSKNNFLQVKVSRLWRRKVPLF